MTDGNLWTLEKNGHKATASTRTIAGVGVERFASSGTAIWHQSQIYRLDRV